MIEMEAKNTCCICLHSNEENIAKLECDHIIHSNCLIELLTKNFEQNKQYECPLYSYGLNINMKQHAILTIPRKEMIDINNCGDRVFAVFTLFLIILLVYNLYRLYRLIMSQ
jgi:hypothetical protein